MNDRTQRDIESFVAALLARAPCMSFMQLCRLLEARASNAPGLGSSDTARHEPVRFRPWARMGFPSSDMTFVTFDEARPEARPAVSTTFFGLYGVDAPLPSHLIDDIALRVEGHDVVEAFLDPFHHRQATLLYRAWKKYRYPESFQPGGADAHSRRLLSLAGFGWGDKPRRAGLPDSRMLALLGLLIQRTRTPEGLAGVVALTVPGAGVHVDEFFPVLAEAGQPLPLTARGRACAPNDRVRPGLGAGYVLGRRLAYRGRAVRVTLCPVDAGQAHDLLPGARLHGELLACVRLYVGVKADVHLRMTVSSRFVPAPAIGGTIAAPAPRLGWTTVLPAREARLIHIALGVSEAFPAQAGDPRFRA